MNNRIGIFGGTFDPIHWGHLFIAGQFAEVCELDKILFIPAYLSPLKQDQKADHIPSISTEDRLEMIKVAIKDNPKFFLDDFEINREKVSYSIETIEYLENKYKDDELFLLIGEDNANVFFQWNQPEAILKKTNVFVYRRGETGIKSIPGNEDYLSKMTYLDAPLIDISSSDIRTRCKGGKSVKYWVPSEVEAYIQKRSLYR